MPLQNRVDPTGEIVAVAARGEMMGNRGGRIHTPERELTKRRWNSRQWICCEIAFRGRQRMVMGANTYTELFFLDEVTALAAGHRPCFECRRQDAVRFAAAFPRGTATSSPPTARDMDLVLHAERLTLSGRKRLHPARLADLPDGVMIRLGEACLLVMGDALLPWSFAGYGAGRSRRALEHVVMLTPPSIVAAMRRGYQPRVHHSARFDE